MLRSPTLTPEFRTNVVLPQQMLSITGSEHYPEPLFLPTNLKVFVPAPLPLVPGCQARSFRPKMRLLASISLSKAGSVLEVGDQGFNLSAQGDYLVSDMIQPLLFCFV